jgi:hypothetical protein
MSVTHSLTLGASSDAFFVLSADKLAILAGPILTFLPVRELKGLVTTTTHNNQNKPPPQTYPPLALPSHLSMRKLLVPPTNGATAPYDPTQVTRGQFWRRDGWFACLGGRVKAHQRKREI